MTNRILIYEETNRKTVFKQDVKDACRRCNELISIFHSFQDWQRIESLKQFIELCEDPGEYFDGLLIKQLDSLTAGKKPAPAPLAELLGVDRANFLNLTTGKPVSEGCEPCGRVKVKPGTQAISLREFNNYSEFLEFSGEGFTVNEDAVEKYASTFDFYAENEQEVAVFRHYQELCRSLNRHQEKYGFAGKPGDVARSLGLGLTGVEFGTFMTPPETIKFSILKLRQS